jgi:antagonist of KipI
MKGSLEVKDGGLLTTVQDAGRVGYRKYGVPVCGVMDDHAYRIVNWLVGNPEDSPVLEMTLKGGSYQFNSGAIIALSGGEAKITLNAETVKTNTTIHVKAEDIIQVGQVEKGFRIYLAVRGEWDLKKVMGSYSTYLPAEFGGVEGSKIKKGDVLKWSTDKSVSEIKAAPKKIIPHFSSKLRIRFIEGSEWDWLSEEQKEQFLNDGFEVSSKSNRMGIRLEPKIPIKLKKGEMKSAPVIPGIVQLPASGKPIVLMNDAQMVGGYPRIAKVADADLWRLGQARSGILIKFSKINTVEAKKLRAFQKNLLY